MGRGTFLHHTCEFKRHIRDSSVDLCSGGTENVYMYTEAAYCTLLFSEELKLCTCTPVFSEGYSASRQIILLWNGDMF